jgi:hypothetical protein
MQNRKRNCIGTWVLILVLVTASSAICSAQEQKVAAPGAAAQTYFQSLDATFSSEQAAYAFFEFRSFIGSAARRFNSDHRTAKVASSCIDPPGHLLAWFPLNNVLSSTTQEVSQSGEGLLVNGPTPTSGMVQQGLYFDGVNDFVEVAGSQAEGFNIGRGDLSMVAWVKLGRRENVSGVRVLIEKRQNSPLRGYSFYLYNGRPGLQLADASGYTNFGSTVAVPRDGRWHLIAVTVDRSADATPAEGSFYLDGVAVGAAFNPALRPGDLTNGAALRLGSTTLAVSPGSVFNGGLDEAEIFWRRLHPEEVRALFDAGMSGQCQTLGPQEMHIRAKCDNGKTHDFEVTGIGSAYTAYYWIRDNCDHSVTIIW